MRIATVALGATVVACTLTYVGSAAAPVKRLKVSTALNIPTLDGIMSNSVESMHQVYDSLVLIAPDGRLRPGLATKWSSNATGTRWTFTIRKGVRFHNGRTMTPRDVVWSFNKVIETPTSLVRPAVFPFVESVAQVGGTNRVVFAMKTRVSNWPRQSSLVYILPERVYNATTFASKPIGTGPFQVVRFDVNRRLVLKAFPRYWGGKPAFDEVTEDVIADETARLNALRSGAVDVAVLSPATYRSARADRRLTVRRISGNLVTYIGFNTRHPALGSVAFRQAVDRAINRVAIARSLYQGLAKPSGQLLAPVTFGYTKALKPPQYSPAVARRLLSQSGYSGQTIELRYPNMDTAVPGSALYAQAIQGYLRAIGIRVELREQEFTPFIQDWFGRRFPGMFLFSFQPSQLDGGQVYNLLLNSTNYFTNPTTARLFTAQNEEPKVGKRRQALEQLARAIKANMYFSPLHLYDRIWAWRTVKVRPVARPDGYVYPQYFKPR